MSNAERLQQYLRVKAKEPAERQPDWPALRQQWLDALSQLEVTVEEWLKPLTQEGILRLQREPVQLSEDGLGTYEVHRLRIQVGRYTVTMEPVGRNIIGAEGRADIVGPAGRRTIVLQDGEWKLVASKKPLQLATFTELTFKELLEEILG